MRVISAKLMAEWTERARAKTHDEKFGEVMQTVEKRLMCRARMGLDFMSMYRIANNLPEDISEEEVVDCLKESGYKIEASDETELIVTWR